MKRSIVLVIISLLTLPGLTQSSKPKSSDSTCLPNSQLKLALKKIEEGKLAIAELKLEKSENILLNRRIAIKDSIIASHVQKYSYSENIIESYKRAMDTYDEQLKIAGREISQLKKDVKKQKRKTFFARVVATVATTGAIYFMIK
jgi:Tfp pilus assembly protein PilF